MSEEGNKSIHRISRGCNFYVLWGFLFWKKSVLFLVAQTFC